MNHASRNPRVPALQPDRITGNGPGVCVHFYFVSGCLSISFPLQSMATLKEGDQLQMWEFLPVK